MSNRRSAADCVALGLRDVRGAVLFLLTDDEGGAGERSASDKVSGVTWVDSQCGVSARYPAG